MKISFLFLFLVQGVTGLGQSQGLVVKYNGTVGKSPVIADIKIIDSVFSGIYYYQKSGEPMILHAQLKNLIITGDETANDSVSGNFTGKISANYSSVTGTFTSGEKKKTVPFHWERMQQEGSAELRVINKDYHYVWKKNAKGDELGCRSAYSFCVISGFPDLKVKMKINDELLGNDLNLNATDKDLLEAAVEYMDDDFDSYEENFDTAFSKSNNSENVPFMNESPFIYQWQSSQSWEVLFNENYMLSLQQFYSEYTGGAHPNYGYTNVVYSLKTGDPVEMENLFKPGYQAQLDLLAKLQLMSKYNVGSIQQLEQKGFSVQNDFSTNDNFFIQKNGIGFTFNPYEIASYAVGVVTVVIPWSSLQQWINPNGPLAWALKK